MQLSIVAAGRADLEAVMGLLREARRWHEAQGVDMWREFDTARIAVLEAKLGISIGNTTADSCVTLEPIYCLGLCATAPSAMLDGRVVGRLDEARLDALVAEAQR